LKPGAGGDKKARTRAKRPAPPVKAPFAPHYAKVIEQGKVLGKTIKEQGLMLEKLLHEASEPQVEADRKQKWEAFVDSCKEDRDEA
jgi:hypothetical protein